MKNYYQILGVSKEADKNEIKKAYRILAKKYHPDKNKDDSDAIKKFQEVSEAYSVIGDEKSRESYDKKLETFNDTPNNKSNGFSNNRNGYSKNADTKKSKSQSMSEEKFEDLNSYFQSFFGFNAKSNEINKENLSKKKNPIDTTDMFEGFFGKK